MITFFNADKGGSAIVSVETMPRVPVEGEIVSVSWWAEMFAEKSWWKVVQIWHVIDARAGKPGTEPNVHVEVHCRRYNG